MTDFFTPVTDNVYIVGLSLLATVHLVRILAHVYSRRLQHLERMDGQQASISDLPNIPSVI